MNKIYTFTSQLWLYPGKAAWVFIILPMAIAQEISFLFEEKKRGWGSIKISATIGETTWDTSIFPDKRTGSYFLPVKQAVRKSEALREKEDIEVTLEIK
ncbi:MAG: DUF1905 domain-containing protein [Candidatus Dojkabacteria bacterium]